MTDQFPMVPTTLADMLAVLAEGWSVPGAEAITVDQVCIDSRLAAPGSLFVALPGERVDGHDYVPAALAGGARIALVDRPVGGVPCVDAVVRQAPEKLGDAVVLRVRSTLRALQDLAAARRVSLPGLRVTAITGSVGKTTTKEAIASVLSARYRVLKSGGNRNNEIGLPLTLLGATPEHEAAVLEMGMYQPGEIAELCRIARPDIGVVTNVEPVHLERLGTIECIAQAKAELVRALPEDGWAVLNADDPRVASMASLTAASVLTYGQDPGADVRLVRAEARGLAGNVLSVRARAGLPGGDATEARLHTAMLGPGAPRAVLAAVAVGLLHGLAWEEIQQGLDALGQGPRLVVRHGREGVMILDDCYNASPSSVVAALDLLRDLPARRIAVLGDMLELGTLEASGHAQVGREAAEACDLLVTVGARAALIADAALVHGLPPSAVMIATDRHEAIVHLSRILQAGDAVLIKGSRAMQMEEIVAALQEAAS